MKIKLARLLCLIPVIGPFLLFIIVEGSRTNQDVCFIGSHNTFENRGTREGRIYYGIWLLNVGLVLALFIGIGIAIRNLAFFQPWIWISVFSFGPLTSVPALAFTSFAIKEEKQRIANQKPIRNIWEEIQNRQEAGDKEAEK